MSTPTLTYKPGHGGHVVDLGRLVASRLLAQANSGGGKSRLVRQLLEETFGRIQHFVIDPEGEFATLREAHPYVLAAKSGGDVLASPKTARLLCRRLMELGASAVLDLYELPIHDRREFVKLFLTELVNLPRTMWRPLIVVIDEAHTFAPQIGESQALEAVISLCTLGRKRGFCAVLATQRISKLHKDAAAELLNKMIGRTGLDVDVKRAADELGFDKDARQQLPRLQPGEFFVYGPAISPVVTLVKTGDVKTTHPEPGQVSAAPPPAPNKVKAMLAQLVDLPKEAEQEARTLADMEQQVKQLRGELSRAQRTNGAHAVVDERAVGRAVQAALREPTTTITALRKALEAALKFIITVSAANFDVAGVDKAELERAISAAVDKATSLVDRRLSERTQRIDDLRKSAQRIASQLKAALGDEEVTIAVEVTKNEPFTIAQTPRSPSLPKPRSSNGTHATVDGVKPGGQKILNALAELLALGVESPTRAQLGLVARYNLTGGTGAQHVADLGGLGLVDIPDKGTVRLTDAGIAAATATDAPTSLDELHERMLSKLPDGQRRIAEHLISLYPEPVSRAELGAAVNYNLTGGTGAHHVADLVTLGIAKIPGAGKIAASGLLFPEGL